MTISWSGQHTRGKALSILERAVARASIANLRVEVLGDGKLRKQYKNLARKLGVDNLITWHGWLPKNEAQKVMGSADVFIITSLRDLTSTVLLEALSKGKPVVCLDHCGFSDVIDETCGIKIPVGKPKDVIDGFAAAILRLQDEKLRQRLSEGALKKAKEYLWAEKAQKIKEIYGESKKKVLVS